MRISEVTFEDSSFYTSEIKERVESALRYVSQISEIEKLLKCIKEEAKSLRQVFLTAEEQAENSNAAGGFDEKLQRMMYATFINLEKYQLFGWKELFDRGEDSDENGSPD